MKYTTALIGLPIVFTAAIVAAMPTPAFGTKKTPELEPKAPEPAPGETKPPFVDTGVPLHGSSDQSTAGTGTKLDQSGLAGDALRASSKVTNTGSNESGDLQALLARAKEVTDKTTLSRRDVVSLRIQLQRFREQDEETARIVDDETRRLEAIIVGLAVEPGDAK